MSEIQKPTESQHISVAPVLSVLIPVRQEILNLKVMLRILRAALLMPHEVIVIYDAPDDPGVQVVDDAKAEYAVVRPLLNDLGPGVANALRVGVAAAKSERILVFAADEVGPVVAVDDMMALMDDGVAFISATRYAFGGRRLGGSPIGHLLSSLANRLLRMVSAVALTDSTTGIKMFRRADFPQLTTGASSVGWAVAFEMAVNAQRLGLSLGEVPIISIDRLFGGKSTFRLLPWVIGYMRFFVLAMCKLPFGTTRPSVALRIPTGMEQ